MVPINLLANETVEIDPEIWKACAGRSSRTSIFKQVPEVGTNVYYFPEGHAEQYDLHPAPAVEPFDRPMVPCRVLDVRYFADRTNDELFAVIVLQPPSASSPVVIGGKAQREVLDIDWETKVLTQSDANGGCGLTVPKECAESILPLLELEELLPAQILTMSDVQGRNWEFRHVYQGKPARHVLAAGGWNNFCNAKLLVSGDTVVLMKDKLNEELYIGFRRLRRPHMDIRRRSLHLGDGDQEEGVGIFQRFVEEAARCAAQGLPFEVVLYPSNNGFNDFVVHTRLVDTALRLRWAAGVRVKMNLAALDCSKPRWIDGRVSDVMIPQEEDGQWRGSPWKMLEITWDQPEPEPELPQNVERTRLSPWQVENLDDRAFLLG